MPNARRFLGFLSYRLEQVIDPLKLRLKKSLGLLGPVQILPYSGFGTSNELLLKGRVLENKGIARAGEQDKLRHNLTATIRRFSSVEIPGAEVEARIGNAAQSAIANHEGYFDILLRLPEPLASGELWHSVEYRLITPEYNRSGPVRATGKVLVPPPDCQFGVISDIDDTVIETHATNFMKMIRITFLKNARSRLPFSGVARFYQELQKGRGEKPVNPIF